MKFNLRFSVALQILIMCYLYKDTKITSNFLSSKIGADPAIIRQIMYELKKAGYILGKPGPGGTTLNIDLAKVSLEDVYNSVCDPNESILKIYDVPPNATEVERIIKEVSISHFESYKKQLLNNMCNTSIMDLCNIITQQKEYN